VACLQALVTPRDQGLPTIPLDDDFWKSLSVLADDTVVGVRIGVARLLGFVSGSHFPDHVRQHNTQNLLDCLHSSSRPLSGMLWDLVHRLSQDDSHEVRSYIPDPSRLGESHLGLSVTRTKARVSNILTFSRPPPSRRPSQQVGRTSVDASGKADCLPHVDRTLNHSRDDHIDLDNVVLRQACLLSGNSLPLSTASMHTGLWT
jgi:hypothetical protein